MSHVTHGVSNTKRLMLFGDMIYVSYTCMNHTKTKVHIKKNVHNTNYTHT